MPSLLQQARRRDARLAHGRQGVLGAHPDLVAGAGDGPALVQHDQHLVAQRDAGCRPAAIKVKIHVGGAPGAGLVLDGAGQLVQLEAALAGKAGQQAVGRVALVVQEGQQQVLGHQRPAGESRA